MFPTFPSFEFPNLFGKYDLKIDGKSVDEYFNDIFETYKSTIVNVSNYNKSSKTDSEDKSENDAKKNKTNDTTMMNNIKSPTTQVSGYIVSNINIKENDTGASELIKTTLNKFYENKAKHVNAAVFVFFFNDITIGFVYNPNTNKFNGYQCKDDVTYDKKGIPNYNEIMNSLLKYDTETCALSYDPKTDVLSDYEGNEIISEEDDNKDISVKEETSDKTSEETSNKTSKETSDNESFDFQKMYTDVFDALYDTIEPYAKQLKQAEKEGKNIVKQFYDEFWNILEGDKTEDDESILDLDDETKLDNDLTESDKLSTPESSEESKDSHEPTIAERLCEKYKRHMELADAAEEIDEDEYAAYLADVIEEHIEKIIDNEEQADLTYSKDRKDIYISFYLDDIDILQHDMKISEITPAKIPNVIYSKVVNLLKQCCGFKNVWFYNDRNDKDELTDDVICKCQIQ